MGAGSAAAAAAVGLEDDEGEEVAALKPSKKLGVGVVEFFWLALIALVSGIPSRAFSDFGITLIHVPHTNENMLLVHQYRNTADGKSWNNHSVPTITARKNHITFWLCPAFKPPISEAVYL